MMDFDLVVERMDFDFGKMDFDLVDFDKKVEQKTTERSSPMEELVHLCERGYPMTTADSDDLPSSHGHNQT